MSKYKRAILGMILANTFWGAGAPIFKWAFVSIYPFTLGFFRFAIPSLLLFFFVKKKFAIKAKDMFLLFLIGLFEISFNIGFFNLGVQKTISINAPIIVSSGPIFLLLGSIFFLREKPRRKVLLGNLLGLTGVLLIIIEPLLEVHSKGSVIGNIFLILSMLAGVLATFFAKKLMKKYDPMVITFWAFTIGALSFAPFCWQEIQSHGLMNQLTFASITAIIYGSIFSSLIAYVLYFWSLKQMPASETSVFAYIDPISGIVIAMPLVHEYPNILFGFGALLVFLGVFISENRLHYHPVHKLLK